MKIVPLLAAAAMALGVAGAAEKGGTLVFAGAADPTYLDPAIVSDGESFRVAQQIYEGLVDLRPGRSDIRPMLAKSWDDVEGREDVDVPAAARRQVPRRHAVQRGRRLRELQPVVQLQRPVPGRLGDLLLPGDLLRVQAERGLDARQAAVQQLPHEGPLHRDRQAEQAQRAVHHGPRAAGVRDAEPDGDGEVRREQRRDPERNLLPDRRLRVQAPDRHRPDEVPVVDRRPERRARAEQAVLGQVEVREERRPDHHPADLEQHGSRPGAAERSELNIADLLAPAGRRHRDEQQPAEGVQPAAVQRRLRDDQLVQGRRRTTSSSGVPLRTGSTGSRS